MPRSNIKDAEGRLLGLVEMSYDGTKRVRNAEGQLLGSHDLEITKLIATGNALTGLLIGCRK